MQSERIERLAEFLCSEFDFSLNPCVGYSWPEHKDDDGYRGDGSFVKLQPSDVQAYARENATRILAFLEREAALSAVAPPIRLPTVAVKAVLAERQRQVDVEGWTPEHDDKYGKGELLRAAKAYFAHATGRALSLPDGERAGIPFGWPWDKKWWKPKTPRQNLVRAGALALAEIERLKRLYHVRAEHRYVDAEAYYRLIIAELERLDHSALSSQVQDVAEWQPPQDCDGKEQLAFETWAANNRYDMHEHPLHYLFMDPKTNAARQGWKAALQYVRDEFPAAPAKQEGGP